MLMSSLSGDDFLFNEEGHRNWVDRFVWVYRKCTFQVEPGVFDYMKGDGLLFDSWTIGSKGVASFIPSELKY